MKIEKIASGNGVAPKLGDTVTVHYTGWLTDGTKFDSSLDHGQPFSFQLGAGQVIKGWDQGVAGMRIGGKRHLVIPPDMGYGANGSPPQRPIVASPAAEGQHFTRRFTRNTHRRAGRKDLKPFGHTAVMSLHTTNG